MKRLHLMLPLALPSSFPVPSKPTHSVFKFPTHSVFKFPELMLCTASPYKPLHYTLAQCAVGLQYSSAEEVDVHYLLPAKSIMPSALQFAHGILKQ